VLLDASLELLDEPLDSVVTGSVVDDVDMLVVVEEVDGSVPSLVPAAGSPWHVPSTQNCPASQCASSLHGSPSVPGILHATNASSAARLTPPHPNSSR
jgi:hypothetical protein